MQIIFYLFLLLLFLYFFHQVIIKYFSLASFLAFGRSEIGVYLYFLFFLPGVVLHELSHLFSASILGVPTGRLTIFPHKQGEGWSLGQVASAETDLLRSSLIGLAPIIIGAISLVLIANFGLGIKKFADFTNLLLAPTQGRPAWQNFFFLYLILTFANTMFLSKEDRTSIWAFPTLLGFLYFFGKFMGFVGMITALENLFLQAISPLILGFSLTAAVDLLFLLPLVLLTEILAKLKAWV